MSDPFLDALLPAAWRGVPFEVLAQSVVAGRRIALHEYPFRDTPYAEDMGRVARRIPITGFVIGDDVSAQVQALLAACEQNGPGQLDHPTLGSMQLVLVTIETTERWEERRAVEFRLQFVEAGQLMFPLTEADTQAATVDASATATDAVKADYASAVIDIEQLPDLTPGTSSRNLPRTP
jgi:prophage DNA circulation protein